MDEDTSPPEFTESVYQHSGIESEAEAQQVCSDLVFFCYSLSLILSPIQFVIPFHIATESILMRRSDRQNSRRHCLIQPGRNIPAWNQCD